MSEPRTPSSRETTPPARRAASVVRAVGISLVILALGFVAQRLYQHLASFWSQFSEASWSLLLFALLSFTASQLLLSSAWHLLLRWQGAHGLRARDSHVLCGRAQISKYIPGNVFQYVARHLAFRRLGVSDGSLLLATAYETLSFVIAAGLLAAVGLPFYARQASFISPPVAVMASLAAAVGLLGLVRYGRPLLKLVGRAPPPGRDIRAGQVLSVVPLYAMFLGVSGCLALMLYRAAGGEPSLGLAVIPAYSLAWLSGYVVPGASGGLGIREATLLVLLGDTPEGLFVSIGMRLITTLGDVLWFAVSSLVAQRQHAKA